MKKTRKSRLSLARALERAANPAYLVSMDREILDMNQACLDWLGIDLETARGATCRFTSDALDDPIENQVAGLCPPPELISGEKPELPASAVSIFRKTSAGPVWRSARMTRLTDAEQQPLAILVVAGCEETAIAPGSDDSSHGDWQSLHQAVAEVRVANKKRYALGNLIGCSAFADRLRRQTIAIAQMSADVLITGPAGSGREHLARTIAATADDESSDSPGLAVLHCVLADEELTSETIASLPRNPPKGQRSILLLLDIDKLTSAGLHVVIEFLKDNRQPVRLVATSERSLLDLANENAFPMVLAQRLTTLEIPLVAIVERREDLPLLAQAFLERENVSRSQQLAGFDLAAMQQLTEFNWPGNLEQLQQVVAEACHRATAAEITVADLPDSFRHAVNALRIGKRAETKIDLSAWLAQLELELIQRALGEAKGNKAKAAKLLGVTRSKLLRRIEHFQVPSQEVPIESQLDEKVEREAVGGADMIDPSAFEELD